MVITSKKEDLKMKAKKWALIFLLFTGIMLFAAQSALGGCEVAALDELISEGNAPGLKLEGPLTVFYQKTSDDPPGPEFTVDMYWFLRLRKGSDLYSFAGGPATDIILPTDLLTIVPGTIETFFINTVVPAVVTGCDIPPEVCPEVILKSYDLDVDDETPLGDNAGLLYSIANIVIGLHD